MEENQWFENGGKTDGVGVGRAFYFHKMLEGSGSFIPMARHTVNFTGLHIFHDLFEDIIKLIILINSYLIWSGFVQHTSGQEVQDFQANLIHSCSSINVKKVCYRKCKCLHAVIYLIFYMKVCCDNLFFYQDCWAILVYRFVITRCDSGCLWDIAGD